MAKNKIIVSGNEDVLLYGTPVAYLRQDDLAYRDKFIELLMKLNESDETTKQEK